MRSQKLLLLLVVSTIFSVHALFAQNRFHINGRVAGGASGNWLMGVNVVVLNTSLGTATDQGGNFRLPALPKGDYKISFSYLGYSTQLVTISLNQNVTLPEIVLSQTVITGPVVTAVATRAKERISPVTFNTIQKEDMTCRYPYQDIPEIVTELPATMFYSEGGSGIGYNYMSIRGFDQRRISVMINGIPQNDPSDHNVYWVDFPDFAANLQDIQVQRGAGSAFYGPAAIGGSINIQTDYFSPTRQVKFFSGYGSFNTQKYAFAYNSGLIANKVVFNARLSKIQSDGYRDRSWVNFWSYFLGGAYYTERSSLRVHCYGGPIKDGLTYVGLPKFYNDNDQLRRLNYGYWELNAAGDSVSYFTRRRTDEMEKVIQPHFEIIHELKLKPSLILNNSLFYIKGVGYWDYDGSWGWPEYYRLTPEYGFSENIQIPANALIRAAMDKNQIGWLPQMTYQYNGGELIVGAELRAHRGLYWGRLQKGDGLPQHVVGDGARRYYQFKDGMDIASVYAHNNIQLWNRLFLMTDLQYAYKKYLFFDEKYLGTKFNVPYHIFNPRLGLNYNLSSLTNMYVSLSNTTREPRLENFYNGFEASDGAHFPNFALNADSSYNFDEPMVAPENLTDIELGINFQTELFKGGLNFYYMDFHDEIIKQGALDQFGQPITGNAARTLHTGVEWKAEVHLLPQLSLSGNVLQSKNELVSYTEYDAAGKAIALDGNPVAGFPSTLFNARLSYAWENTYLALALRHVGKYYTNNHKDEKLTVDPYSVVNFYFRYRLAAVGLKGVIVQANINNLLNRKYMAHGEGATFFPAATRNGFVSLQYEIQ